MFEGVLNMPLLKNKAGVMCAKRIVNAATWYVFLDISMILGNVWLRNVRFEIF